MIDTPIDPFVRSLEHFRRLLDGVLDAAGDDGLRVEIAKDTDLSSTDRKTMLYGAGLVLVHYDDQLGLLDQMRRDHLGSVCSEVDAPAAGYLYGVGGRRLAVPYESCGSERVFLPEESVESPAQYRCRIGTSAKITDAHDEDRWRHVEFFQTGYSLTSPPRVQQLFAAALHDVQQSTVRGNACFRAALAGSPLVVTGALSVR